MVSFDSGKVIAYVGGSGVSFVSLTSKAEALAEPVAETITLLQAQLPVVEITIGDVTAIGGFAVVVARFVWDIYKDRRDQKRLDRWTK